MCLYGNKPSVLFCSVLCYVGICNILIVHTVFNSHTRLNGSEKLKPFFATSEKCIYKVANIKYDKYPSVIQPRRMLKL